MRRSIEDLRTFYGEPAGALARRLLARRLDDAWGEATNSDVLGVGSVSYTHLTLPTNREV